jgi:hypothetical protein
MAKAYNVIKIQFMFRYAYTGNLALTSIHEAEELYNFAKDYGCEDMVQKCIVEFQSFLNEKNVFQLYDKLNAINEDDLQWKCLEVTEFYFLLAKQS